MKFRGRRVMLVLLVGIALWTLSEGVNWADMEVQKAMSKQTVTTPATGSQFVPPLPHWQSIKFEKPNGIKVGIPVKLSASYTAELFDIPDLHLSLKSFADSVKITGGTNEWQGTLKKGETKTLQCEIVVSTPGKNYPFGLEVKSSSVYPSLHKLAESVDAKSLIGSQAKKRLDNWLASWEKDGPVYENTFDCLITTDGAKE